MENCKRNENSFPLYSSQSTTLSSSSSETVSSVSYLAIYERRKRTEQANLYAKQAQERSHHTLLEKSIELEKQRIVNKVMEAENKATKQISKHYNGVLLSRTSNALIKMSKDCCNKFHLHDKLVSHKTR